jgi:citrate lyase subunit beta / citryl-CoA lyase
MSSADPAHRSYLFAPGSSPEVMRKALASAADAVVLDLEDAVAPDAKRTARAAVAALLEELAAEREQGRGPATAPAVHIRINRQEDRYDDEDLTIAVHPVVEAVRLPKAEDPAAILAASTTVRRLEVARGLEPGAIRLHPTVESALGVLEVRDIAGCDPRVGRLVLGQADLVADLGARGDDALTTLVPRALVALASRAAGIGAPVDGATTDLSDARLLDAALERARALGYSGKSAIHPRQLDAIHAAFTPSDDELAAAARIVRAAAEAGGGATRLDGNMIDTAIVRRAESLLRLRRDR